MWQSRWLGTTLLLTSPTGQNPTLYSVGLFRHMSGLALALGPCLVGPRLGPGQALQDRPFQFCKLIKSVLVHNIACL